MTISEALWEKIQKAAKNRCSYCLMPAEYVYAPMEIDHIIPVSKGGNDDEQNLCLACPRCNNFKSAQTEAHDPESQKIVPLFNPRQQIWKEHFQWEEDKAHIRGQTPSGRATVEALQLNHRLAIAFRLLIVQLGWYPPKE